MKFIFKITFIIFLIAKTINADTINIAVAANVSYAIDDLKKKFCEFYPDIRIRVIIGSSGKLTAQIKHKAPYQIFMSADMFYPEILYNDGYTVSKPKIYAKGKLVYFSKKSRDFSDITKILRSKYIQKIAVANPKTAPYGKATLEALKNKKIYKDIVDKFVYGESISQTFTYALRVTDIGIVAKSLLYSPKLVKYKNGINYFDVDEKLYTPINQGIVILKKAKDNKSALLFYNFILSNEAKKILNRFGYITH